LKSSHQLSKYNGINFWSKQRSFYFTKSSRGPDSTSQRAGFCQQAIFLTPLRWMKFWIINTKKNIKQKLLANLRCQRLFTI